MSEYGGTTAEEYAEHMGKLARYFYLMGGNGIVKIKLYTASWCQPCKVMKERLRDIQAELPNLTIEYIDVENNKHVAIANKVRGIPVLTIDGRDGYEVKRFNGLASEVDIKRAIEEARNE